VEITASAPGPSFGSEVLTWILLLSPFLLIGWLWTRLSRGAGGQLQGVLGVGRSRAKVFDAERPQRGSPTWPGTKAPSRRSPR
jgi:cell division protease FtsH